MKKNFLKRRRKFSGSGEANPKTKRKDYETYENRQTAFFRYSVLWASEIAVDGPEPTSKFREKNASPREASKKTKFKQHVENFCVKDVQTTPVLCERSPD